MFVRCLRGEEATEDGGLSKGKQAPARRRHESTGIAGQIRVLPLVKVVGSCWMGTQNYVTSFYMTQLLLSVSEEPTVSAALNGGAVGGVMQNTLHVVLKFRFALRLERWLGQKGRS